MSKFISLSEAKTMTYAYQDSELAKDQTISSACDSNSIQDLLNQKGCDGIRFYYALNTDNKLTLVVVGTDKDGNDMTDGLILNRFVNCPPLCPKEKSELMK